MLDLITGKANWQLLITHSLKNCSSCQYTNDLFCLYLAYMSLSQNLVDLLHF